jgi:hypothetical protein
MVMSAGGSTKLQLNSGSSPIALGDQILITSAGLQGDEENIVIPDDFDSMIAKHDKNADGKLAFKEIPNDLLFTQRFTTDGAGDLPLRAALRFFGIKPEHIFERKDWEEKRDRMIKFRTGPLCRTSAVVVKTGGEGDVTKSHRLWEQPKGVGEVASPLVYLDKVYLVKNGGVLTVRSLQTGEQIYAKRIRGGRGGYYASPIAADGRVYFASDDGVLSIIDSGPKLNVLSQCRLAEPIYATPAIVGDTLYVRSKTRLYAFVNRP